MAEFKVGRLDGQPPRIRNVPIAITPEGFWCCPSQAALQKTTKNPNRQGRPRGGASPAVSKASLVQRAPTISSEKRAQSTPTRSRTNSDEQVCPQADAAAALDPLKVASAPEKRPKQHKISVGFGQLGTSDLKVVLYGKEGVAVKMIVHKNILAENSTFFMDRLSRQSPVSCIEVPDCEDVEIYVETVGLMYCKDVKQRLIKQNVPRVLRILKVAESLGFRACIMSCLDYLEAVPWVGDEEENVVSSIRQLHNENHIVNPLLKRVTSDITNPPNDTLAHIIELVLKSSEDRGRREMKSLVLKLLKENVLTNASADSCVMTLYSSCRDCLESLLTLFRQASDPEFPEQSSDNKEPVFRKIALEADNLLWLTEILSDKNAADELTVIWASQGELAKLHCKIPVMHRHLVSCVTARLFVAIGKGEVLPSKETRQLLLDVWLQPLMDDNKWLQHGCRSFDRKAVEDGIGQTILTLPLEDQQAVLLAWLGRFLKVGDSCPNLQRAFEVWWRRTFVRPYAEQQGSSSSRSGRH
ncbi:BTB/POZ domain-containing protein At3g50780-like [Phragmites australis]|uniref:BTB/POZ domain-containing protein At3g50780-like n=1 Tax=Phragmites australis TaxID=29695 RepID=UPI002D790D85|nr:BTB/POZ domain-containing protein At3g50780-like [Phragmites australis]XP_062190659.1 BTB/POZ domain-containing protein At3g50780-like [Phragmites australis]